MPATITHTLTGFVIRPTEEQRRAPIANIPPGCRARLCFINDSFAKIVLRTRYDVRVYVARFMDGEWIIDTTLEQRARTRYAPKMKAHLLSQCGTLGRLPSMEGMEAQSRMKWRLFGAKEATPHTPCACVHGLGVQCFCDDCRQQPPCITFDRVPKRALVFNHWQLLTNPAEKKAGAHLYRKAW